MPASWLLSGPSPPERLLSRSTFALAWSARRQAKVAAEHVVAIQRPLVSNASKIVRIRARAVPIRAAYSRPCRSAFFAFRASTAAVVIDGA
jgi:hypothetical protein